jgi:Cu2+-exporting ATPase
MQEHHAHHHAKPGHGHAQPGAALRHDHAAHDKHAGHSPQMFRERFWLSVLLGFPILYRDAHIQEWFGYQAVQFPGVGWVQPVLSIVCTCTAAACSCREPCASCTPASPA